MTDPGDNWSGRERLAELVTELDTPALRAWTETLVTDVLDGETLRAAVRDLVYGLDGHIVSELLHGYADAQGQFERGEQS